MTPIGSEEPDAQRQVGILGQFGPQSTPASPGPFTPSSHLISEHRIEQAGPQSTPFSPGPRRPSVQLTVILVRSIVRRPTLSNRYEPSAPVTWRRSPWLQ